MPFTVALAHAQSPRERGHRQHLSARRRQRYLCIAETNTRHRSAPCMNGIERVAEQRHKSAGPDGQRSAARSPDSHFERWFTWTTLPSLAVVNAARRTGYFRISSKPCRCGMRACGAMLAGATWHAPGTQAPGALGRGLGPDWRNVNA